MISFVCLVEFFRHSRLIVCNVALAATISLNSDAGQFKELAELIKAHEIGLKKCCSYSYQVVDERAGTSFFYGGEDRCLAEYRLNNRVRVFCNTPEYYFELKQKDSSHSFFVEEIKLRDEVQSFTSLTSALARSNHRILSLFYYFDIPIAEFLVRESVSVEDVSRRTDSNGNREVTVTWKWDDKESGVWVGRFVLLPDRFWCARRIERTRDFSIGVFTIEHSFDESSAVLPLFLKRSVFKQFVGKDIEILEKGELSVISDTSESKSRFRLSFYGLSDEIGKRSYDSRVYFVGFALVAFLILFLLLRRTNSISRTK